MSKKHSTIKIAIIEDFKDIAYELQDLFNVEEELAVHTGVS